MGSIILTNIQVYAYHGCLVEEGKIGSDYRVDVSVDADLQASAESDKLDDTVDYVKVYQVVNEEMGIRSKLLEHVTHRIIKRLFSEVPQAQKIGVRVSKINPPVGGHVEKVCVEMTKTRRD